MNKEELKIILCILLVYSIIGCKDKAVNPILPILNGDYELCYNKPYNGHAQIFINNISGTNPRDISKNDVDDEYPQWSPDGKFIVFSQSAPILGPMVIVYEMQKQTEMDLTSDGFGGSQTPKWTPNGKVYFYYPYDFGTYHGMYIMNPDGSDKKKMLDTTADIYFYNDSYNFIYIIADMGYYNIYKSNINNTQNEFIADLRQTLNHDVAVCGFNPITEELLTGTTNSDGLQQIGLYSIRTNTFKVLITYDSSFSPGQYTFSNGYAKIAFIEINNKTYKEEYLSIYENGTKKRLVKLTGDEWFDYNPMHFSYDDKYIAFSKNITESIGGWFSWKSHLYIVEVSSGKLQYIDDAIYPSWKPNP